ncbi:DUF429 domain-containing protein [Staphylococcus canis]|uniref:DUF429 domain-containing protein n=1 Tax=Staphylococcus canis TaxID=2724942 RepID=A0ABS0T6N6_9STAP|nr:DUF429 domain-containing protein [Staphylococcus canis]MBI5974414.1 DUF429 domain-containing protein [Staphylococcus canis]
MHYIGIDLAWTDHNETGVCVIDHHGTVQYMDAKVWSDAELISLIQQYNGPLRIAIDAPLIVPNEKGARQAERLLSKDTIHHHRVRAFQVSQLFLTRTFGRIRGADLLAQIQQSFQDDVAIHINTQSDYVVETFPTAITASLFRADYPFHYKEKKGVNFKQAVMGLQKLHDALVNLEQHAQLHGYTSRINPDWQTLKRQSKKHIEDQLDALLCAYGLYLIHHDERYESKQFGESETGAIVIPFLKV